MPKLSGNFMPFLSDSFYSKCMWGAGDGSATYEADYSFSENIYTLTFAPGEMTKEITVSVLQDSLPESDEYFYMGLSTSSIRRAKSRST